jgi:hypothetical protein
MDSAPEYFTGNTEAFKKLLLFLRVSCYFNYNSSNIYINSNNYGQKISNNGAGISFTPGLSYLVCKKLYIELSMPGLLYASYAHSTTNISGGNTAQAKHDSLSIGPNLSSYSLTDFGIGFKFILGK